MSTFLFWINNNAILCLALLLDMITIVIYLSNYIKKRFSSGIWEVATFFYLYHIVFLTLHHQITTYTFILCFILLAISRYIFYRIGKYLYVNQNTH